jgi:hypothetical protein
MKSVIASHTVDMKNAILSHTVDMKNVKAFSSIGDSPIAEKSSVMSQGKKDLESAKNSWIFHFCLSSDNVLLHMF